MTILPRIGAVVTLAAILTVVSACSAPAPQPSTSPTGDAPAASATPEPSEAAPTEPAADPTCETIIPASTVADFESISWSPQVGEFRVGVTALEGGIQCMWADFSGPATDHVQIFGWAPISSGDATTAQAELVAEGWVREDSPSGTYITENPDTTVATDENGYGMTYLFGDGWVKLADTKQGLLLVEWAG